MCVCLLELQSQADVIVFFLHRNPVTENENQRDVNSKLYLMIQRRLCSKPLNLRGVLLHLKRCKMHNVHNWMHQSVKCKTQIQTKRSLVLKDSVVCIHDSAFSHSLNKRCYSKNHIVLMKSREKKLLHVAQLLPEETHNELDPVFGSQKHLWICS